MRGNNKPREKRPKPVKRRRPGYKGKKEKVQGMSSIQTEASEDLMSFLKSKFLGRK